MKYLFLNLITFFLFIFQQFFQAAIKHCWFIDLILPTFLWFSILNSISLRFLISVFLWSLVVDTFSSILLGLTFLSYIICIFLTDHLKMHFDMKSFLPYHLVVFLGLLVGEILRLLVLPVVFDFPLPEDVLIGVLFTIIVSLIWSFILWYLNHYKIWRELFAC